MSSYEIVVYIEKILKEKNTSKSEFYAATGISAAVFSHWRNGDNFPPMQALETVNKYLGTDFAVTVNNKPATDDGSGLSYDQTLLIEIVRKLPPQAVSAILATARLVVVSSQDSDC